MKTTIATRIEKVANISIVLLLLVCAVLVLPRILLKKGPTPVAVGSHVSLPGVDWTLRDHTLLLVLSTGCHFCSESAGFYKVLSQEAQKSGTARLIAVFPQDTTAAHKYLDQMGLRVDAVLSSSLSSVRVMATPTILLVDKQGVVTNSWMGRLTATKEAAVLSELKSQ
jgi:hypothetical protein